MKRRIFIDTLGKGAAAAFLARNDFWRIAPAAQTGEPELKPNIVLILADDLGYADLGIQGCPDIPTPNIDSIGRNGVRFTHGYVSCPLCAPTRAGLMTGRYQQRFGFEHNPGPMNQALPEFGLPQNEPTIAERLKKIGYATGMFGKWHLGFKPELQPMKRGFDEFFGFLGGAHSYLPGSRLPGPSSSRTSSRRTSGQRFRSPNKSNNGSTGSTRTRTASSRPRNSRDRASFR